MINEQKRTKNKKRKKNYVFFFFVKRSFFFKFFSSPIKQLLVFSMVMTFFYQCRLWIRSSNKLKIEIKIHKTTNQNDKIKRNHGTWCFILIDSINQIKQQQFRSHRADKWSMITLKWPLMISLRLECFSL